MSGIPRFEVHLDASIPHSEDTISPVELTKLLDQFEELLKNKGATVTIQTARTTRTELPSPLGGAKPHALVNGGGDGPTGQYL